MRCIFCKQDSSTASAVEHVIPESMGNTRHTLPRGFLCDACNNYFSREVEAPLLNHQSFRNLRAWYQVPTKRGVMPRLYGFLGDTDIEVGLRVGRDGMLDLRAERERNTPYVSQFVRGESPTPYLWFPRDMELPEKVLSRFLAKMAVEIVALRMSNGAVPDERMIDEPHFDRIRNWARRGDNLVRWPVHQRQIYPEETLMKHPTSGYWVQVGYSYDIFATRGPEHFFAFSYYGHEFVINLGGPAIKGYTNWLEENSHISPLIERVGGHLRQGLEGGAFYLDGNPSQTTGAKFDEKYTRGPGISDS
jgi:hypothetical protein